MAGELFPALMIGSVLAPVAAFGLACVLFVRRRGQAAERRVSGLVFVLAMLGCGLAGGYLALMLGVALACPQGGDLCGLVGVFVTGPLGAAAAILAAATALTAKRSAG